ncbi:odorant receptor 45a-like [Lucilia sericata]|uniref:odorant receptor 45a-like n=1 Tax=Lucilia sericata TaxID=13632 RepID=UPI0018A7FFF3|nr:odorant receptor 45a-like [Lucilia sericata]
MVVKGYFNVQKLTFAICGIDTEASKSERIIKRPHLCYVPLFFAITHVTAIVHYAYVNRHDYVEVTDSLALSCQSLLAIVKTIIFIAKREQFVSMIREVHSGNFRAGNEELPMIRSENFKDVTFCTIYFRVVSFAAFTAFSSPILEAIYFYVTTGKLILRVPYKASYFWPHSKLPGYSLVYLWNILSIYNLFGITLAIDTLFTWLVSNISAQFHILCFRFKNTADTYSNGKARDSLKFLKNIKSCIQFHNQTLELTEKLNQVYGEIIFIKFIISCSEICCLVFRLSRPSESMAAAAYQCLFLITVAMQLILYCYNGQRIRDESLQVTPEIYFAFDWTHLPKSCKKLLLVPMMRSQKSSQLKAVLFIVDLSLFLWVFKTAGSLITALKTLDENQD